MHLLCWGRIMQHFVGDRDLESIGIVATVQFIVFFLAQLCKYELNASLAFFLVLCS